MTIKTTRTEQFAFTAIRNLFAKAERSYERSIAKEQKAALKAQRLEKKQFLRLCMGVRMLFKKFESRLPEAKLVYCPH
jgi:hypothetical protein